MSLFNKNTSSVGKWINEGDYFRCSVCDVAYNFGSLQTIQDISRRWNYCANCGAAMNGYEDGVVDDDNVRRLSNWCEEKCRECTSAEGCSGCSCRAVRDLINSARHQTAQIQKLKAANLELMDNNKSLEQFAQTIIDYIIKKLGKTQNILSNEIVYFIQSQLYKLR